jgi:hypothetical protein
MIYAAFHQAYGINLATASLHWWEFRALLINLPDTTRMGSIMGIRATDTSEMSKHERRRYDKLKKLCAIGKRADKPQTLAERDAAFLSKLEKRKSRNG